MNKVG